MNLVNLIGSLGTIYLNLQPEDTGTDDNYNLTHVVNALAGVSGVVLSALMFREIGLDGGMSTEEMFGENPNRGG